MTPYDEELEIPSIKRWLEDRGISDSEVARLPDTGFVNRVYQIGKDKVFRITKNDDFVSDSYTEVVAVPIAVAAGVTTPRLLDFDDSRRQVNGVVTLYELAEGVTLGRQRVDQAELPSLYTELGWELGVLHSSVKGCPDPHGYLDKPEIADARSYLYEGRQKRKIEAVSYDWLSTWLDRIEPALAESTPRCFLHDDLHSFNLMVHLGPLRLSAILDWGDAGWGDPALEFGCMPIWAVDWMLEGYESVMQEVDDGFLGRLLWHDIGLAIEASINQWVETDEPWQPLTTSRWINLVRFFAQTQNPRWAKWTPPG